MAAVFALQAQLLPRPTDLSWLNWTTNRLESCASANFEASAAVRQRSGPLLLQTSRRARGMARIHANG